MYLYIDNVDDITYRSELTPQSEINLGMRG